MSEASGQYGSPTGVAEPLPRVLFISVNPFSETSNNGKTFASFFEGYGVTNIAQLYFHRELPSSHVCDNYFRVTDEELMASLWRPWRVRGERVSGSSTSASAMPAGAHGVLKASGLARLLRQLVWTQVRLDNPELLAWIDEFDPEVVFFCGGDAAAMYPKVAALANRSGARLAMYVTDDYVLPVRTSPSARVQRRWTRKVFNRMACQADLVLTIGEMMSATYEREFRVRSVPVMNMVPVPATQPGPPRGRSGSGVLTLLYAGSLHSNRWKVLGAIADTIEQLAADGIELRLRVVGPEPTKSQLRVVHRPPLVRHDGLLGPDELLEAISGADVLVHVEDSDRTSMGVTALSVSTKIPEYLASGRCVLAVGPRDLASIDYLASHSAALVVDPRDPRRLYSTLELLATQPDIRDEIAGQAFALARANHDGPRVRQGLWDLLRGLVR